MKIQVIVSSKHGSTREIAAAIADELGAAGHEPELLDAGQIACPEAEAVVLGSAVYAGSWLSDAQRVLDALDTTATATWLFSSGPLGDPPMPDEPEPIGVPDTPGIRGHVVFAGKLDRKTLSLPERMITKALHAPEGDFRDLDTIRAWARAVAKELSAVTAT